MKIFNEGRTFNDARTLETLEALGERMMAAFNQIIKTYQGKSIGIINHGDPIRALWFQLIHSHKKYPTYSELIKMVGLGTMEGMRLQINSEGKPDSSIEIIQGI